MTMPNERARALVGGYELIRLVLDDPNASAELKQHAKWVARHYPCPAEIGWEARRQTMVERGLPTMQGQWLAEFE